MTSIVHQLSLNENFAPALPGVREAAEGTLGTLHLTPDPFSTELVKRIAAHHEISPDQVLPGVGSGALLQQFLQVNAGPGSEVVHPWPSFEMYPLLIRNAGATAVGVPLREFEHDLDAMAAAVTERTRVVLLCNPNNPTGAVLSAEQITDFLGRIPEGVHVVLDEAYLDFADSGTIANGLELLRTDERLTIARTFSKSYGLIALRVGYLVAAERVLAPLKPGAMFFRVSAPAQAAAAAALEATAVMRRQCAEVAAERDRLRAGLRELGFDVPPSGGNFLWLPLGADSEAFVRHCAAAGIGLRVTAERGVRLTVGTREVDDLVLEVAGAFAAERDGAAR
ncbi:aminotransferase class I/II-fold pyridoxal phosphate-dependent enzyme [Saccharopolyspora sp. MS10]|uniref:aminotransferase class I/II-fold pyridoxal phosphate-dependent enzyme n=1 Tax=Saccharopolyspora sp. MS10 TaxID=3385973 RepID=UPI0039A215C4